jgi:two-component system phosphate regulon sensor histidine kinase PhoR
VPPFLRRRKQPRGDGPEAALAALRGRILVEESREPLVVLDDERRVVAASRRARESVEGLVEGAPVPSLGQSPLEIPYEIDGRRETLVYLTRTGGDAAYEELRVGFTAAVSHELRTPLARLMALLESAELQGSDPAALVEQARQEVDQIGELIDDVLLLSELESGREVAALGLVRALPVLEAALEPLRDAAARAEVALKLACPASAELPLRHRMLEVVATNLAENAIRYAGAGATFTLSVIETPNTIVLEAADDGGGVADEELPRLFERFFRSDRSRATRGSGLGLAIVKHVVTSAGGTVDASRTADSGLLVRATFPGRVT